MDRQRRHAPVTTSCTLPLLSVFKFHVALAVLDKMDKQSISLDSIVSIKGIPNAAQYLQPLRKKFPDQDFTITLRN